MIFKFVIKCELALAELQNTKEQKSLPQKSDASRQFDGNAVVGWLDIGRQFFAQRLVVEIGVQIGQDRPLGAEPFDPAQRIGRAAHRHPRRIPPRDGAAAGRRLDAHGH